MRITQVEVSEGELLVFDYNEPEQYDPSFMDDTPIHLPLKEALATMEVAGYGKCLSKLVVELTGYSWIDKEYLHAVIKFLKENYPAADISWEETFNYLEDIKLS
jgi:hypothetical protein